MSAYCSFSFFFFFKQKTAYELMPSLVGSEMCIRDRSVGVVEVGGERVAIRAGWAAFDRPLMVAGIEGSVLPRPVVSHRAFDGKEPLVIIGDDQEGRFGSWGVGHGGTIARFLYM